MAHILSVDDLPMNNDLIVDLLAQTNHTATAVLSSSDALIYIQQNPVDLFIIDVALPKIDGVLLSQLIRRAPAHAQTPIILVTALHLANLRRTQQDAQAQHLLVKPFNSHQLLDAVNTLLMPAHT